MPSPTPEQPTSNEQSTEAQAPIAKPTPAKKLPDWKPLGTVRDYFTEQMKHDSLYGR